MIQSRGILEIYRNTISENKIQKPDMGKDSLIPQLALSLDIKSDNIDDINEEFYSEGNKPDYD